MALGNAQSMRSKYMDLGTITARIDLETIAPELYMVTVEGDNISWQPLAMLSVTESDTDA